MKKKRSWLKWLGIVAGIVIIAAVVGLQCLDFILKGSIEQVGSMLTKSKVTVDKVNLSLRKGELLLENLKVGNPEGYKTDEAFSFSKVFVSLNPRSLMTDVIQISEIQIMDPALTVEAGLGNTNLGTILDNVKRFVPAKDGEKPKEEQPEETKEGKRVEIDHVIVRGGKVRLSAKILGGAALPVPLPGVELRDIGKEKEDEVGLVEASALILNEMLTGALKAVMNGAGAVVDGGKAVLNKGKEIGKGIVNLFTGGQKEEATADPKTTEAP